jgi:hypothetical protein
MSDRPSRALLDALGLDGKAFTSRPIALPQPDVALGLSVSPRVDAGALLQQPRTPLQGLSGSLRVEAAVDPLLLLIESEAIPVKSTPLVSRRAEGLWILDLREAGKGGVVFEDGSGLAVENGSAFEFIARSPMASALDRLFESEPRPVTLSIDALLGRWQLPGWLRDQARKLAASPDPLLCAAGAGLVARFWRPPKVDFIDALRAEDNPARTALRWYRALEPDLRERIETQAQQETWELNADLELLPAVLDRENPNTFVWALASRRDQLESISVLCGDDPGGDKVRAALEALDKRAAEWNSLWSSHLCPDDPLFAEVAAQTPEAWWGSLAAS